MTALKPVESRSVVGVPATKYTVNVYCASPVSEPGTPADDPHHCVPRSQQIGNSYFVSIDGAEPIPHVVGLSRRQHERVENHEAWIKLENGIWNWYERELTQDSGDEVFITKMGKAKFKLIGPLNPQPGQLETSTPKRKRKQGEARRKRRTISLRVPEDTEDGAGLWDEQNERIKERLVALGLYSETDNIPIYEARFAAAEDWLNEGPF